MVEKVEYETYYDEYGDLRKWKIKSGNKKPFKPFSRLEKLCISCLIIISINLVCITYLIYKNFQFYDDLSDSISSIEYTLYDISH